MTTTTTAAESYRIEITYRRVRPDGFVEERLRGFQTTVHGTEAWEILDFIYEAEERLGEKAAAEGWDYEVEDNSLLLATPKGSDR